MMRMAVSKAMHPSKLLNVHARTHSDIGLQLIYSQVGKRRWNRKVKCPGIPRVRVIEKIQQVYWFWCEMLKCSFY